MGKNNFIIFILFSYYCYCTITTCTGSSFKYHTIENTASNYEHDIELDWTDNDEKTISIPFDNLASVNDIIPLFVNATSIEYYENPNFLIDANLETTIKDYVNGLKTRHKNMYDTASFISDYTLDGAYLKFTLKADKFKANNEDVNQKYIKYFCWYECASSTSLRFRQSGIIIVLNNAKLLKLSKYLMGFLLLLL